jgi:hypothetical protein
VRPIASVASPAEQQYCPCMSCLGVHFALSDLEVRELTSRPDDEARLAYVQEEIEEDFFANRQDDLVETNKAWDPIHRFLTDGTLDGDSGDPLELVVLGGRSLYSGDDYIIVLKTPEQVRAVAPRLAAVTKETFRAGYDRSEAGDDGDEHLEYAWEYLQELREFWLRAAERGRTVLFTVDQ